MLAAARFCKMGRHFGVVLLLIGFKPRVSDLISLKLSFPICKVGITSPLY